MVGLPTRNVKNLNADQEPIGASPAAGAGARQRTTAASRLEGLSPIAVRYLQQAARELDQGRLDESARALQAVAALAPEHPEVLRLHALLAARRGQPHLAMAPLQRALAQWPDDAAILGNIGSVLVRLGDTANAVRVFTRASEVVPGQAGNWLNLGLALEAHADHAAAGAALRRALELEPRHPAARIAYAANLATLGDIDGAAAAYRAALVVAPRSAEAWLGLVNLKTTRLDEVELVALEQLYSSTATDEGARATAGFALGKALEDHGRLDEAFSVLQAANAARRRRAPWDSRGFSRGVDLILDAMSGVAPEENADARGSEVIFVVGMPRSGSTLVEQIISAHPEVEGASELPDLDAVIREESQRRQQPFTAWAPLAGADDWRRLGERYLERTARWRMQRPRHTDKMPDNWLLAGAALAMLPGARVVDCERDALETAWSCYKQWFADGRHLYAYDFADLAAQLRDHARAVAFWQAKFPDRVRVQSHEALAADPETEVRALLDFCGLAFDPACLRFHEAGRAVRSASAAQVRQPLSRDTARARAYGDLLAPLRRLLAGDDSAPVQAPVPPPAPDTPRGGTPVRRHEKLPAAEQQRLARAETALAAGQPDAAAADIEAAASALPDHAEPVRLRALLLESRGRRDEAIAVLEAALVRWPDDALLHNTLGAMQGNAGDLAAARTRFERAFALDPESAACENLARMRLDEGDREGARALYEDALARAPHLLPARLRLASLLRDAGDWVPAAAELRLCLKQDPACVPAWSALVDLADGALAAPELEALLAACRQPGLAEATRARLSLACGRVLESRGRMREGYAMIAAANAWRARNSKWDGVRDAQRSAAIARAFESQSTAATDPQLGSGIVFILDTPAGGADLEAVLAAHPDIAPGGECGLLAELVAQESRRLGRPFTQWAGLARATDWQRLGEAYLERSARLRGSKPYATDRSPELASLLGAAAAMLPGARVIDVRRDPLEACWRWHRDGRDEGFAPDLVDLARYWQGRDRLLELWRSKFAQRMLAWDGDLRGEVRADALRGLFQKAGFGSAAASIDALASRDRTREAVDAREAGLRQAVRARDHGALLHPLQWLLAGGAPAAGDAATPAQAS